MKLLKQHAVHSRRTVAGTVALAIATACTLSLMVSLVKAGPRGGDVKAPSATIAVKTSPSSFSNAARDAARAPKPTVAKEPCRGRGCPHHWPPHTH